MLDDDHGIARSNQTVELADQFFDVRRMQTRGWLIKDIERTASMAALQLGGQFDALGFAAGKLRGRLA